MFAAPGCTYLSIIIAAATLTADAATLNHNTTTSPPQEDAAHASGAVGAATPARSASGAVGAAKPARSASGAVGGRSERTFADLESLVSANTVTISRLLEIAPPGTTDPSPFLYDTSFYSMAGIIGVASVANSMVTKVDAKLLTPTSTSVS